MRACCGASTTPASSRGCNASPASPAARSPPGVLGLNWAARCRARATPERPVRARGGGADPRPRRRDHRRRVDRPRPLSSRADQRRVAAAYDEHLFHGATCRTCPTSRASSSTPPTCSRARCGASRSPTWRDYRVGKVDEADRAAGAGGRRVVRLSARAVALRDAARPGGVHARTGRPAARAIHHQGRPDRRRRLRQPGAGDGVEELRTDPRQRRRRQARSRRRSRRATGPSTPTACSTSIDNQVRSCASAR